MRSFHALLFLCAAVMGGAAAMHSVQRYTLILTEGVMWTDGNPRAKSVFINGTSPGPTLRFQVGQRVVVRVISHLPDANTTVHFHGLSQSLHPASDGTGMLTHWPIAPGNFFDYELQIDKRDAGTTFCHAHVGLQATAAFAPVIVEDKPPTIPRSAEERIMAISDYFYQSDQVMESGLLGAPFIWPGSAKGIALNGAAWGAPDACNATLATAQGVKCEASTYAGPAVIDVDYAHHYRLRWIGVQTLMHLVRATGERNCSSHSHALSHPQAIGIFGHSQHIIAADGTLVRPVKTEFLELLGGQRYDSHLVTKSKREVARDGSHGCYPIRFETRWRTPATNGWAMLSYPGAHCNTTPTSHHPFNNSRAYFPPAVDFWLSHRLHPLHRQDWEPRDEEVSRRVYIHAQQVPVLFNNSGFRWVSNGIYYNDTHPTMGDGKMLMKPYLMQLYAGEREAPSYDRAMTPPPGVQRGFDSASNVFVARRGEVVDVVIINNASVTAGTTEVRW